MMQIKVGPYRPGLDNYGVAHKSGKIIWASCREVFHRSYRGGIFYFCTSQPAVQNIIKFIDKAEEKARTPFGMKCVFHETNHDYIIGVDPGAWWLKQRVRFSLLTILLRCGKHYVPNRVGAFDSALNTSSLVAATRKAVVKFFEGHTLYLGGQKLWYRAFSGSNKDRFLVDDRQPSQESMAKAQKLLGDRPTRKLLEMTIALAIDESYEAGRQAS